MSYATAAHYIIDTTIGHTFAILSGPHYPHDRDNMVGLLKTYRKARPHDVLSCVAAFDVDALRASHEATNRVNGYADANGR